MTLIGNALVQIICGAALLALLCYALVPMIGHNSPEDDEDGEPDDQGDRTDADYDRDRDERARL